LIPPATSAPPPHLGGARGHAPENASGRQTEDRRLVRLAASGNTLAFDRLTRTHSGLVLAVAVRVLGARDAPDASQEVWIKVWRNMGSFRGDSAFTTWLYRIAMNTCLGLRRTRLRREQHQHDGEEASFLREPAGGDADPEAAALNSERSREMRATLGHLRAEHRAALVLRHMDGRPYAEIAEILGVPSGTAKGWVSRGRTAMLLALAEGNGAA